MREIDFYGSARVAWPLRQVGPLHAAEPCRPTNMLILPLHFRWLAAVIGVSLLPVLALAQNAFSPGGPEYPIAGSLIGEQTWPRAAVGTNGGVLVWQDNAVDGSGLGIRATRLDVGLAAIGSVFRVNSITADDQEKPQVALLQSGGAAIVWQGGVVGFQNVFVRFLNSTGTNFVGTDVRVNTYTNGFQIDPAVTVLTDGSVIIVWASDSQDGSYQGIYGQRFTAAGVKTGGEFRINQFVANNQRSPAVAALAGGGFVVSWISELQQSLTSVDVYARLYNSDGSAVGNEFPVNTSSGMCSQPAVVGSPNGGFAVAWSQRDIPRLQSGGQSISGVTSTAYYGSSWDVMARVYNVAGGIASPSTSVVRLNTKVFGDQYSPRLSSFGGSFLATWISLGQDSAWEGIYGQFLGSSGDLSGVEFRANATAAGRQTHPSVCSDGASRFLVIWSSFVAGTSYDLMARVYDLIEVSITSVAGGLKISWNTQPGSVYQLQKSTNYSSWSNYGAARTASGFADSVTINNQEDGAVFRVIRIQ